MNHSENNHSRVHAHESCEAENENKCGSGNGKHPKSYAKLCPLSLAMAAGLVNGLSVLILAWLGSSGNHMYLHGEIVRRLDVPGVGGQALFGFIAGFVGAWIFAWIYNKCLCCWKCRSRCSKCGSRCFKCS
jgi:hypothetical protein